MSAKHAVIGKSRSGFEVRAEAGAPAGDSLLHIRAGNAQSLPRQSGGAQTREQHGCVSVGYNLPVHTSKQESRCLFW